MANYKVNGSQNLTNIFQLIGATTPVSETRYKSNGSDLNTIFAGFVSGTHATPTGYIVKDFGGIGNNNKDLSDIFQHDPLVPYITTGTVTTTSDGTYNRILTWTSSGTITFYQATVGTAPNAVVTGGGAGGGSGNPYGSKGGEGGGGAPPQTVLSMSTPTLNATYVITVGVGGSKGTLTYNILGNIMVNAVSGLSSIFAYTGIYTGAGGIVGAIGGGGSGGATNTNGGPGGITGGGGGGAGGSSDTTQYSGGAGNGNGGSGGAGGYSSGSTGKGVNGSSGITPGGGGGGGGSNSSGYTPPTPLYASGGDGAQGSVVFKFNI